LIALAATIFHHQSSSSYLLFFRLALPDLPW
jgi:hypothetical protein